MSLFSRTRRPRGSAARLALRGTSLFFVALLSWAGLLPGRAVVQAAPGQTPEPPPAEDIVSEIAQSDPAFDGIPGSVPFDVPADEVMTETINIENALIPVLEKAGYDTRGGSFRRDESSGTVTYEDGDIEVRGRVRDGLLIITKRYEGGGQWLSGAPASAAPTGVAGPAPAATSAAPAAPAAPAPPPPTATVNIVPTGGQPADSVILGQTFQIEVTVPQDWSPGNTVDVVLTTPRGEPKTLTLHLIGSENGLARYGYGGLLNVAGMRNIRAVGSSIHYKGGDPNDPGTLALDLSNGEIVRVQLTGFRGPEAAPTDTIAVYDDEVQQGIARNNEVLNRFGNELISQRNAIDSLSQRPDVTPAIRADLAAWKGQVDDKLKTLTTGRQSLAVLQTPGAQLLMGNRIIEDVRSDLGVLRIAAYPSDADVITDSLLFTGIAVAKATYKIAADLTMASQAYKFGQLWTTFWLNELDPHWSDPAYAGLRARLGTGPATNEFGQPITIADQRRAGLELGGGLILMFKFPKIVDWLADGRAMDIRLPGTGGVVPGVPGSLRVARPGATGGESLSAAAQRATALGAKDADDLVRLAAFGPQSELQVRRAFFQVESLDELTAAARASGVREADIEAMYAAARAKGTVAAFGDELRVNLLRATLDRRGATVIVERPYAGVDQGGVRVDDLPGRLFPDFWNGTLPVNSFRTDIGRFMGLSAKLTFLQQGRPVTWTAADMEMLQRVLARPNASETYAFLPNEAVPDDITLIRVFDDGVLDAGRRFLAAPNRGDIATGAATLPPAPSRATGGLPAPGRDPLLYGGLVIPPDSPAFQAAAQRLQGATADQPAGAPPPLVPFGSPAPATSGTAVTGPTTATSPGSSLSPSGNASAQPQTTSPPAPSTPLTPQVPPAPPAPPASAIDGGAYVPFDAAAFGHVFHAVNASLSLGGRRDDIQVVMLAAPGVASAAAPPARTERRAGRGWFPVPSLRHRGPTFAPRAWLSLATGRPSAAETTWLAADGPSRESAGAPRAFISSLGKLGGSAFQLHVSPGSELTAEILDGLVVEPLAQAAQQELHRAMRRVIGQAPPSALIDAYCLEFRRQPPPAGTAFRVASKDLQQKFAPMRRILQASRRLERAGRLEPDSDPAAYAHSIRQWALWTHEQGLDRDAFAKAFIEHTRKNLEKAGRKWETSYEKPLLDVVPLRWRQITDVLREAGVAAAR
jgi:hypothetical protein